MTLNDLINQGISLAHSNPEIDVLNTPIKDWDDTLYSVQGFVLEGKEIFLKLKYDGIRSINKKILKPDVCPKCGKPKCKRL